MSYVDPLSDDPHGIAARLIAEQFSEWERLFKPIELQALSQVSSNNPQVLTDAVNKAQRNAEGTSNAMYGITERENAAMGVTPNAQQKVATGRILDINKSLNVAAAENTARTQQRALDEQILMGAAPNPNIVNSSSVVNRTL
jgi:hypothetical protein